MLLSVIFLPQILGIYSLVVGFTFIYGITSVLNLILLNKCCVEKPKYLKFLLLSTLLCVPTIIFGLMLEKLLLSVLGIFLTFIVCSSSMLIFQVLLFFGFNLISVDFIKTKIKRNKTKLNPLKTN
jgi:hypothetical protein